MSAEIKERLGNSPYSRTNSKREGGREKRRKRKGGMRDINRPKSSKVENVK